MEIEKERKEEAEKLRLAEEERKKEWQKKKEERYSFVLYVNVLNLTEIIANRIKSSRLEGVFDDNFSYFSSKPYVVTPHLNCVIETVQMRDHNMFICRINKNYL